MTAKKSFVQRGNTQAPVRVGPERSKKDPQRVWTQSYLISLRSTDSAQTFFHSDVYLSTNSSTWAPRSTPAMSEAPDPEGGWRSMCSMPAGNTLPLTKILARILNPSCPGPWSWRLIVLLFSGSKHGFQAAAQADAGWPSITRPRTLTHFSQSWLTSPCALRHAYLSSLPPFC